MEIKKLVVGQLQTNCYLVWDKKTEEAVIIDPGDAADFILQKVRDLEIKPKFILATHGHFDHILAVVELKLALKIPFLMHEKDSFLLKRMGQSAKYFTEAEGGPAPQVDKFIQEGDLIEFGQEKLKVMETPGHSPGGVAFYSRGVLFSGDTLFRQGVGRTDFSYASAETLGRSIKKLLKLPQETKVYPGHGELTKIGLEHYNQITARKDSF